MWIRKQQLDEKGNAMDTKNFLSSAVRCNGEEVGITDEIADIYCRHIREIIKKGGELCITGEELTVKSNNEKVTLLGLVEQEISEIKSMIEITQTQNDSSVSAEDLCDELQASIDAMPGKSSSVSEAEQ